MEEKMIRVKALVCLTLLWAATSLAYVPIDGAQDQAIGIAYYDQDPAYLANLTQLDTKDASWSAFVQRHGHWAADFDDLTGMIHRAYGGTIYVGIPHNTESAGELAQAFLNSNADLLRLNTSDLVPVSSHHGWHYWEVELKQQYGGIDVFGGRVSVSISDRGNITQFRCDYFPGINVMPLPSISANGARSAAGSNLTSQVTKASEPELIIFPVPGEKNFEYRLAYKTEISTDQPARWLTIVDATTGELLYRRNLIYYDTVDGFIHGLIYPATPFDTLVSRPFEFETVNITGLPAVQSDRSGFFTAEAPDQSPRRTTLALSGLYVDVQNSQGVNASYIDTITPGDTLLINWASPRARNDERNTYYQTNVVHDFINALDPEYTGMDFALTANVNLNQTCNAYWDGSSINLFMAGGGCSNTGELANVIWHEYGHGITDFQYRPSSPSGAQHEGWSDYIAATMTNQPLIGLGFYSNDPNAYLRSVLNHMTYPESLTGESHNDGLIVAGALWDLRTILSPRTGYCDSLWHFARYGRSSNFQDYLLDVLRYDDDDDDLSNGTPHWNEITTSFGNHGIEVQDRLSISHRPLSDTLDDANPYTVVASMRYVITRPNPDSIFTKYRTNGQGSFQSIHMLPTANPNEYSADIPAQPLGTMIEYYIYATDMMGQVVTSPVTAPLPTYFFLIGQLSLQRSDSLESASGWVRGAPDDDARTGQWERCDPNGTYGDTIPHLPYQPEDDHTPDPGVMCFVTQQHPRDTLDNGYDDVDYGRTSETSPVYDLSSYQNPVVEYYSWFTTNKSVDDTLKVLISSDAGTTWNPMEIVTTWENYWRRSRYLVSQFASDRSRIKLRFVAADEGANSLVEAAFDDISFYSFNATSIGDGHSEFMPVKFALHENCPNPFNGKTEISYDLAGPSDVSLSIYDISGRLVQKLSMPNQSAGNHSIIWDSNQQGHEISSGIYFYRIQAGNFVDSRKMLLLK